MKRFALILLLLCGCVNATAKDISAEYIGIQYIADPLGENMPPDTDPLIRTDAFDCVTFVETVLADADVEKLTKIRYRDGVVDFLHRNHFIESDWLTNNSDLVENVSMQYAPTLVRRVVIDKQNWLKTVHGIDAEFEPEIINLQYIPYKYVSDISISEPMIVLFITGKSGKSDTIGTDLAVVHVGFLLPDGILRHASSAQGRVMDTDFYKYADMRAKDKNNLGIVLVRIK